MSNQVLLKIIKGDNYYLEILFFVDEEETIPMNVPGQVKAFLKDSAGNFLFEFLEANDTMLVTGNKIILKIGEEDTSSFSFKEAIFELTVKNPTSQDIRIKGKAVLLV